MQRAREIEPSASLRLETHLPIRCSEAIEKRAALFSSLLTEAVLAGTVKGKLVRRDFESLVRKFDRLDFPLVIDQDVVHAVTYLADKVLMPLNQGIEVL